MSRPKSAEKLRLFQRVDWMCSACGGRFPDTEELAAARKGNRSMWQIDINHLTVDHVLPKSQGGSDSMYNMVAMCYPCNQKKADALPGTNVPSVPPSCCCNYGEARSGENPDIPCDSCQRHVDFDLDLSGWMCKRHVRRKAKSAHKQTVALLERVV